MTLRLEVHKVKQALIGCYPMIQNLMKEYEKLKKENRKFHDKLEKSKEGS